MLAGGSSTNSGPTRRGQDEDRQFADLACDRETDRLRGRNRHGDRAVAEGHAFKILVEASNARHLKVSDIAADVLATGKAPVALSG